MRVICSVEDFRACRDMSLKTGKWQAWSASYYTKYRHVFDWMLRFLYYLPAIESLRGAVEELDFDRALARADAFLAGGGSARVQALLEVTERVLRSDFTYDVLLMIGLGHVNGTVIPQPAPATYFGLETRDLDADLEMVVPHEFNHLIRLRALLGERGEPATLDSFDERVIAEGLATVTPLIASGAPLTPGSLAKALMMPRDMFDWCEQHWPELWQGAYSRWDNRVDRSLMAQYLMGSDTGWFGELPARSGYYVGTRLIVDLLQRGHQLPELTRSPARRITDLWGS